MEEVAGKLGAFVLAHGGLRAAAPPKRWTVVAKNVSRVGDVVDMLGLSPGQTLFAPQTVQVHEVHDPAGALFETRADAEVLLLGDSFSNVYSLGQMGWGESAGLAPHLARALERDVDVIAQNDAGAFATRKLLWNELTNVEEGQPDRLEGKKVVIWELASRELAVGNWRSLVWPVGRHAAKATGPAETTGTTGPVP